MTPATRNPYVGPRPFGSGDADYFFGREAETDDLLSLILTYPAVVLYSESGAGKTSLLNAKIVPGLRDARTWQCEVIGPLRVSAELAEGEVVAPDTNIYVLSALLFIEREIDRKTPDVAALSRMSLAGYLAAREKPKTEMAIRPPRVVIFDQFEELFVTRPDRWRDRESFFEQVTAALEADPRLRVVFAMKEEFLGGMEALAEGLPDGARTRLRLERLRKLAAMDAVEKPLAGTGVRFGDGVAERLVNDLLRLADGEENAESLGEFVEPLHLQLVCDRIWKGLQPGADVITDDDIKTFGDVDTALAAYYDDCVAQVAAATGHDEGELRGWIQKNFITSERTRGLVYRMKRETAGLPNNVLLAFQKLYIIRPARERSRWYELAHERSIGPIIAANARWRRAHQAAGLSLDLLESRAEAWQCAGREAQLLIRGRELPEAAALARRNMFAVSNDLRDLIAASEIAQERRRAKRLGAAARRRTASRHRARLGAHRRARTACPGAGHRREPSARGRERDRRARISRTRRRAEVDPPRARESRPHSMAAPRRRADLQRDFFAKRRQHRHSGR